MKNKILLLVIVAIVIVAGVYFYSKYFHGTPSDDPAINIPCSFVFKTKSDNSGSLTVGSNKLFGDYYYTNYGCGIDVIKNTGDSFAEVYKCKNTQGVYGFTYSLEELKSFVNKNELSSKCQKIK